MLLRFFSVSWLRAFSGVGCIEGFHGVRDEGSSLRGAKISIKLHSAHIYQICPGTSFKLPSNNLTGINEIAPKHRTYLDNVESVLQ